MVNVHDDDFLTVELGNAFLYTFCSMAHQVLYQGALNCMGWLPVSESVRTGEVPSS